MIENDVRAFQSPLKCSYLTILRQHSLRESCTYVNTFQPTRLKKAVRETLQNALTSFAEKDRSRAISVCLAYHSPYFSSVDVTSNEHHTPCIVTVEHQPLFYTVPFCTVASYSSVQMIVSVILGFQCTHTQK